MRCLLQITVPEGSLARLRHGPEPVPWLTDGNHPKRPPRTESQDSVIINRLTVDGKDYFLPEPVTELRGKILEAIKAGGGYVNIPPLRSGPGIDILFSPGMPVTWAQIEVANPEDEAATTDAGLDDTLSAL